MIKNKNDSNISNNPHAGHRERLRNLFISNGLNGFAPHSILELLLFFSIPRNDTNEIAHELINEFGSLSGVFEADFDSLCRVRGIGKRSATLIMLVSSIARELNTAACTQVSSLIEDSRQAAEYLKPKFVGAANELVVVLCVDNRGVVRKCKVISTGGFDYVRADVRTIVTEILNCKASAVYLAHNHPHGFPVPSESDILVTKELSSILSAFKVRVIDHIIFAADDYLFMSANRNVAPYLNVRPVSNSDRNNYLSDKKR